MSDYPFRKLAVPNIMSIDLFDAYRGRVISHWAGVESCIDQANHFAWLYSKKEVSDKVPVGLSRKLNLFEKVNRDLLPFEPLREDAARLLERVKALMDDRHWMAHGFLDPRAFTETAWNLKKHEFPKNTGGLELLSRFFTEGEVNTLCVNVREVCADFTRYSHTLIAQVHMHAADDKRG